MDGSPAALLTPAVPQTLPLNPQSGALPVVVVTGEAHLPTESLPFDNVLQNLLEGGLEEQPLELFQAVKTNPVLPYSVQAAPQLQQQPLPQSLATSEQPTGELKHTVELPLQGLAGRYTTEQQLAPRPAPQPPQQIQSELISSREVVLQRTINTQEQIQQQPQTPEQLKPLQPVAELVGAERPEASLDQKLSLEQKVFQNLLTPARVENAQHVLPSMPAQAQNTDVSISIPNAHSAAQNIEAPNVEGAVNRNSGIAENNSFQELLSRQSIKGEQMGDRLMVMLNRDQRHATLRMDPPELGQLKVMLNVDGDQVSVQFQAGNGQLRDMLNQQVDRLRQFFEQQQMNLVNVDISHDRSLAQNSSQGFGDHFSEQGNMPLEGDSAVGNELEYAAPSGTGYVRQGLLDVYV